MSTTADLSIRQITPEDHEKFIGGLHSASFLQNPLWARTKEHWKSLNLGWYSGEELVAAALVLCRPIPVPGLRSRTLAYIADGPLFDPQHVEFAEVLAPLPEYLKKQKAFMIRMAPPHVTRRWDANTVRKALSKNEHALITDLEPLETNQQAVEMSETLRQTGWEEPEFSEDFLAGQAQYQARIPIPVISEAARKDRESEEFTEAIEIILKRMDSSSRGDTRRSTRMDLVVERGEEKDLGRWQALYEETAERDDFTGRQQEYFDQMYRSLNASENAVCEVLFATFEDKVLASSIYVQQRNTAWHVYGASSREERRRNAPRRLHLEKMMMAIEAGAEWLDLGGVSPTMNKEHPLAGLTRFKTTQGADVMETLGEWDLPLSKPLSTAFKLYMARRG